MESDLII